MSEMAVYIIIMIINLEYNTDINIHVSDDITDEITVTWWVEDASAVVVGSK